MRRIIRPRLRFHFEHQTAPGWPSEVITHDEGERHLRKLWRLPCGCMRYGNSIRRPFARIDTASGLSTETNIARLFLTMSADRPLQGSDYACHRCDDPLCAHPDHLYVGTHHMNVRDTFFPGRRIRPRKEARFFDHLLLEVPAGPPPSPEPVPKIGRRAKGNPSPVTRIRVPGLSAVLKGGKPLPPGLHAP